MSAFSFKRTERILKRADFERLSRIGKKIHGDHFILRYCRNSSGNSRLGVTVSKKVGRAVVRNRIKRLIREYYRLHKADMDDAFDILVIAKSGAGHLSNEKANAALETVFHKISKDCGNEALVVGTH